MRFERRSEMLVLVSRRVLFAAEHLVVAMKILSHLQMGLEYWNGFIDIYQDVGISGELAPRPAERSQSLLVIADVHF